MCVYPAPAPTGSARQTWRFEWLKELFRVIFVSNSDEREEMVCCGRHNVIQIRTRRWKHFCWPCSQTCQPCDSDYTEMATLDTAGLSAFSVPHASVMMEVPDVYMWVKCQKSKFFKDNCACSLSMCIRLHFDVSASHTWLTGRKDRRLATCQLKCANSMPEEHQQYLGLKGRHTKRCTWLLHLRVLQQFIAMKYDKNVRKR